MSDAQLHPRERRHSHRSGSSDPDAGPGGGGGAGNDNDNGGDPGPSRRPRHAKKDKRGRPGRKARGKRSLEDELRSDEEKKRMIKEKLRALELQMGRG